MKRWVRGVLFTGADAPQHRHPSHQWCPPSRPPPPPSLSPSSAAHPRERGGCAHRDTHTHTHKHAPRQVDIYALGVVLNEMVARAPPFGTMGLLDIRSTVVGGGRPELPLSCPRLLQVCVCV